jgi:hypothetical protein
MNPPPRVSRCALNPGYNFVAPGTQLEPPLRRETRTCIITLAPESFRGDRVTGPWRQGEPMPARMRRVAKARDQTREPGKIAV